MEIYIEPQLAQPHLVVVGHLATAEALVSLGKDLGWRISLMGLDVARERFPDADQVVDELDFSQIKTRQRDSPIFERIEFNAGTDRQTQISSRVGFWRSDSGRDRLEHFGGDYPTAPPITNYEL